MLPLVDCKIYENSKGYGTPCIPDALVEPGCGVNPSRPISFTMSLTVDDFEVRMITNPEEFNGHIIGVHRVVRGEGVVGDRHVHSGNTLRIFQLVDPYGSHSQNPLCNYYEYCLPISK